MRSPYDFGDEPWPGEAQDERKRGEKPADTFPCSACGKPTHIDMLDAKDDGTGNYTIMECKDCYGPGWVQGNT